MESPFTGLAATVTVFPQFLVVKLVHTVVMDYREIKYSVVLECTSHKSKHECSHTTDSVKHGQHMCDATRA